MNAFLSNGVRQDYAPLLFFDLKDAANVAHDLKFDNTETGNLLLEHSSMFWDTRSVFRVQILKHAVPRCRQLFLLLKPQPPVPPEPEFDAIANPRLERRRRLCAAYGAKLIILVPPTPSSENAVRQITLASAKEGVESLVPVDPAVLPAQYYLAGHPPQLGRRGHLQVGPCHLSPAPARTRIRRLAKLTATLYAVG